MIVPELCPDDGLQAQLPEHVIAESLCEVKSTCKYPVDDLYIQGKPMAALHPPVT